MLTSERRDLHACIAAQSQVTSHLQRTHLMRARRTDPGRGLTSEAAAGVVAGADGDGGLAELHVAAAAAAQQALHASYVSDIAS